MQEQLDNLKTQLFSALLDQQDAQTKLDESAKRVTSLRNIIAGVCIAEKAASDAKAAADQAAVSPPSE